MTEWLEADLQKDIWHNKYQDDNEILEQWFDRTSGGNEKIKQLIKDKKLLFGGRTLANRGLNRNVSYSNCYVLEKPKDNIESIFDCAKKLAKTFSYGGGVGIDLSNLSPRGAKINNAAKTTTGSVSFMDLYSLVTSLIGQFHRRGALMVSLDCSHPDIEEFINIKNDLEKITKANISIRITDDFMKAVENDEKWLLYFKRKETDEEISREVNARDLFYKIAKANWNMAEPGILNWSKIKNWNLLSEDKEFKYEGVNPYVVWGCKTA